MSNAWPDGVRRPMSQADHTRWNASTYPGTRQMCIDCGEETGCCEEDAIFTRSGHGPVCADCDDECQDPNDA